MDATARLQLEVQLRDAKRAELQDRLQKHTAAVLRTRSGIQRRNLASGVAPSQPLDFLAIGDSWFEYPLTDDGFPTGFNQSIIGTEGTQLQSMGNPPPLILNYALHGQASTVMLTYENQEKIIKALTDPNTTYWTNGVTADAILVSAGGDDLAGDQFAIYLDYHGKGLDPARYDGILSSIKASYLDLFALRDIAAADLKLDPKQIPIFGHCYDYAIPNGKAAGPWGAFAGPWLKPSLDFSGYSPAEGLNIVQAAIDGFKKLLGDLAADKILGPGKTTNNFFLVDTIGTLTRNGNRPDGWANELHPYTEGFAALAKKFLADLQSHFPGRI